MSENIRHNFCDIEKKNSHFETSRVVMFPVLYERTTTYLKGTKNAPLAIISASTNLELFDEELWQDTSKIGIHTLSPFLASEMSGDFIKKLQSYYSQLMKKDKFVVMLGGEHTITLAAVLALIEKYRDLSVLQLDAHCDLRDEYKGTKFSHACVARRIQEYCPICQVGIRSLSEEESHLVNTDNIKTIFAHKMESDKNWEKDIISYLSKDVYVTIDMDVFDPSLVPGVGTPEPAGLDWFRVTGFLKKVFRKKNIVGFDIVELMPLKENKISEFLAAKLIYRLIGYQLVVSGW